MSMHTAERLTLGAPGAPTPAAVGTRQAQHIMHVTADGPLGARLHAVNTER